MKKNTRGVWEIRSLAILALIALTAGCAIKTLGMHDPGVDTARILAEVLKAQQLPPTPCVRFVVAPCPDCPEPHIQYVQAPCATPTPEVK